MNKNIPLLLLCFFVCVLLLILSGNFYGLEIWHEIFLGLTFGPGIFFFFFFFGVCLKP